MIYKYLNRQQNATYYEKQINNLKAHLWGHTHTHTFTNVMFQFSCDLKHQEETNKTGNGEKKKKSRFISRLHPEFFTVNMA